MAFTKAGIHNPEDIREQDSTSRLLLYPSSVVVYVEGTTTLATLYTDAAKTLTASNPVAMQVAVGQPGVDVNGNLLFYADPGDYDRVVNGGDPVPVTIYPHPDDLAQAARDALTTGPVDFVTLKDAATGVSFKLTVTNGVLSGTPVNPGQAKPTAPVLSGKAGDTTVTLSWTVPAGATVVQPYMAGVAIGTPLPVSQTSLVVPSLTNATAYTFTATASNSAGTSGLSNAVTITPNTVSTSTALVAVDCGADAHDVWSGDSVASPSPYLVQGQAGEAYFNPGTVTVPGSAGAWAVVQDLKSNGAYVTNNTIPTDTKAFTSNVAAGNRIVLVTHHYDGNGGHAPNTPTSTPALTWTKVIENPLTVGASVLQYETLWVSSVTSAGSLSITCTAPINGSFDNKISFGALEVSGLATTAGAGGVDKTATATGITGTTGPMSTGTTAATTAGGQMCVAFGGDYGGVQATWSVTTGGAAKETAASIDSSAGSIPNGIIALKSSALGATETVTFTPSAATYACGGIAVFKLASGSGTGSLSSSVLQAERWSSSGTLEYDVPVPNGNYTVNCYFAEQFPAAQTVGGRVMNVLLQGTTVDSALDVYATAGANAGLKRTYTCAVSDGLLRLQVAFVAGQAPHLSAFDITPIVVTAVPAAPTLTGITGFVSGKVSLAWNSTATAATYQVYKAGVAVGSPITATSLDVTGLTDGTPYAFTVKAINTIGSSVASNTVTLTPNTPIAPSSNRGPDATYTKPTGAVDVAVGQLTQSLLNQYPGGTKFWLLAGTHRLTTVLNVPNGSQLHGAPGATISGGVDISTGWTADGAGHWWHTGPPTGNFSQFFLADDGAITIAGTNPLVFDTQDIVLDKAFLQPATTLGGVNSGTFYWDHSANRVYIGVNPSGHQIETPAFNFNRNSGTAAYTGLIQGTNITVKNLIVEVAGSGWNPLVWLPGGGLIDHCLLRLSHTQGAAGYSANCTNTIITHNGQMGISGALPHANCEVSYCGELGFNFAWEAGGGKWALNVGNIAVTDTWYHHNWGPGFWMDYASGGNSWTRCTFEDNYSNGIKGEQTPGGLIDHCVFRRNGQWDLTWADSQLHWWVYNAGIGFDMCSGWQVKNTYSYDNYGGPLLIWDEVNRTPYSLVGTPNTGFNIHDNVFGFIGTPNGTFQWHALHNTLFGIMANVFNPSGNTFATNAFYAEPGSAGTGANWFLYGTTTQTFSAWTGAGRGVGSSMTAGAVPAVPAGVGSP